MMSFKESAVDMLRKQAETDRLKAISSLKMLLDNPAGIGDHSTGDLYDNLNESLSLLADANDRLDTLKNERVFHSENE